MMEKKISVQLQHGLQARNAIRFMHKASSFINDINLIKSGRTVAGKSIMGVMVLAIREGDCLF